MIAWWPLMSAIVVAVLGLAMMSGVGGLASG